MSQELHSQRAALGKRPLCRCGGSLHTGTIELATVRRLMTGSSPGTGRVHGLAHWRFPVGSGLPAPLVKQPALSGMEQRWLTSLISWESFGSIPNPDSAVRVRRELSPPSPLTRTAFPSGPVPHRRKTTSAPWARASAHYSPGTRLPGSVVRVPCGATMPLGGPHREASDKAACGLEPGAVRRHPAFLFR